MRLSRWEPRGEEGFSLIEVLVAMALFGLVLAALAGALISSARSVGDQRLRTTATRLATDHLETLRSLPYDELEARAGPTTRTTPDGRTFTIDTQIASVDAATGLPAAGGGIKQITAIVGWRSGGSDRQVTYTTAIAAEEGPAAESQLIGTIAMFPSPSTVDAFGQPLQDIEVSVPLAGFPPATLVRLNWTNASGTAGAATLTNGGGNTWRGTIPRTQVRAGLSLSGSGEVQFTVAAGTLSTVYGLSVQKVAINPPAITGATIDRRPITVDAPSGSQGCANTNQCQNLTDVIFTATVTGLNSAQDSVIVQFQLYDGTFLEVPLTPVTGVSGEWRLIIRQRTTKFLTGTGRAFRLTAIRSADGATSAATVVGDVVAV